MSRTSNLSNGNLRLRMFGRVAPAAALAFCALHTAGAELSSTGPPAVTRPADTLPSTSPAAEHHAPWTGFTHSPYFDEQIRQYRVEPGVQVLVNAPGPKTFDSQRLTRIVLYALPNGNTTAQTVGRRMAPGVDWHFDIQHIGAQTRRLREVVTDENIVVVYLEADGRSWPAWKRKHAPAGQIIARVVDSVREIFHLYRCTLELSGHSGGGSFIFGLIDHEPRIQDDVRRVSFLDSNYGYSDAAGHGHKLAEWLKGKSDRVLSVICYDDRNIMLDGKPVVSSTGGTYRRTLEMIDRLSKDFDLPRTTEGDLLRCRGLGGRIELIVHRNPRDKILHTALVGQMNGFIHAMTVGGPYENRAATFGGPVAYEQFIQPE